MDDLITWLRAQLDDDERIAKAASPAPWRANDETYPEAIYAAEHGEVVSGGRWGGEARCFDSDEDVWHIVRHDPARVLREVEAKRLLLEGHEPEAGAVSWDGDGAPQHGVVCAACSTDDYREVWPCRHVRLLALPLSDRPATSKSGARSDHRSRPVGGSD